MRRPGILLMHCHDVGRYLGCHGHDTVRTPHLDALAAQGVRFDAAFATAPQCSPSRASLFTGRWPHVNGVLGLTHSHFAWDLHPPERHVAGQLRDAGYRTAMIGVHHESRKRSNDETAERLGFDEFVPGGMADTVADRTIERLERYAADAANSGDGPGEDDRPWYLQVGFFEPHRLHGRNDPPGAMGFVGDHMEPDTELGLDLPPYLIHDEGAKTEVAELQGAVRHMDSAAGRILARLEELGMAEDTLVIFTTDHGVALPRAKCTLYDPGLEVTLMIRWPERGWVGGRVQREMISNLDILPTLLEALDLKAGDDAPPLHGRSFLPLLDGGDYTPHEQIFGEITYHDYYDPRRCIRTDRYKLIANFSSAPGYMDSSQSWKRRSTPVIDPLIYHPPYELYDLADDPNELTDRADDPAYADVVADLLRRLGNWMRETDDPLIQGAVTSPIHRRTLEALSG